jgi:deoxyribonuclease V
LRIHPLHEWNVSPREAVELQRRFQPLVSLKTGSRKITLVAGCDLALDPEENTGYGGVIVYRWPGLEEVERKSAVKKITFPYVPGLLSFREAPVLLECFEKLEHDPDLFIFDGQGIAHPRGIGIASHLGLFLDRPTIGCAKSHLYGAFCEPAFKRGSSSPLNAPDGAVIGAVVRTRDGVQPIFVSPGHQMDCDTAVAMVLACADGTRVPKPTREADHFVKMLKLEKSRLSQD